MWYLPTKSTLAKVVAGVLREEKRSTRYWFFGKKAIEREKSSVEGIDTMSRYLRISLLQAAIYNLREPLNGGVE